MVIFYKTWKKCHEIQLAKNKMDLNKWGTEYNINKHNMVILYNTWKRCNEIQLTKNTMRLKQIENEKHKSLARARA